MRVLVLVKATVDSEKGFDPTAEDAQESLEEMGGFNEELAEAGILVTADGLKPSSEGKRVAFDGPSRTVIDGPFAPPTSSSPATGCGKSKTWTRRSPG